jgi:predicted ATPase/DNA-binding SARP family transcriptional activator
VAARVQVTLLGPLRVTAGDLEVELPRGRVRALVARLALDAGRAVTVDALAEALWPDRAPAEPREALQTLVWRLRRALRAAGSDDALTAAADGYALDAVTDLASAEAELAAGDAALREGRDADAQSAYDRARARWSGGALPDLLAGPVAEPARVRLDALRLDAEEGAAEARVRRGLAAEAAGTLVSLAADQPLRERTARLLALARHEQGRTADGLDVLRAFRARLAEETGLDPTPELAAVERTLLRGGTVRPPPSGVPEATTSYVGREEESRALYAMLDAGRCVTVVGPAGVGKTRLVAEAVRARTGTVLWVDLEASEGAEDVLPAVAAATRVVETGRGDLLSAVRARLAGTALVVLDGADGVTAGLRDLAGRLIGVPDGPRLLLTSRLPLGAAYEDVLRLDPLPVDGDAAALFVDRARRVDPGVGTPAQALDIRRVCRALDGLPLALELAASRLGSLTVAELAGSVESSTAILEAPAATADARHGSLRAALEASVAALDDDEAVLLRRLAVFPGEFTASAAQEVAGGGVAGRGAEVGLLDLVARSLVVRRAPGPAGGSRYRLLAPVRTWLRERRGAAASAAELADRHAGWVLARVAEAGAAGPEGGPVDEPGRGWADWLADHHDDVDLALAHAFATRPGDAASALQVLLRLWDWSGRLTPARSWSARALPALPPGLARVRALGWSAYLEAETGRHDAARDAASRAVAEADDLGDPLARASALGVSALLARQAGDLDGAREQGEEALRLGEQVGAAPEVAYSTLGLALTALAAGDDDGAVRLARDAAAAYDALGDRRGASWTATVLAAASLRRGDADGPTTLLAALDLAESVGDGRSVAQCLQLLAARAARAGRPEWAARLIGAADARWHDRGARPAPPPGGPDVREPVKAALGPRWDAEHASGASTPADRVAREAAQAVVP